MTYSGDWCWIDGGDDEAGGVHLHDLIQQLVCFLQVHLKQKLNGATTFASYHPQPHTIFPKHCQHIKNNKTSTTQTKQQKTNKIETLVSATPITTTKNETNRR